MTSFTATTYNLNANDTPSISRHDDGTVSFHLPDYEGRGFCLRLKPCHIPDIERLLVTMHHQVAMLLEREG